MHRHPASSCSHVIPAVAAAVTHLEGRGPYSGCESGGAGDFAVDGLVSELGASPAVGVVNSEAET